MGIDVHLDEYGQPRMVERHFTVGEAFAGHRLDHYLKRMIPRLSRTKLQRIIRTQMLPVRGRRLKPHSRVAEGDHIVIRRPARPEPPCPRNLAVLYDDPDMMVIDKPAGLPMHVSAKFYFNTVTRVLSERFPGGGVQICHRLDRETSGILVVARGKEAAARLKGSFAAHRVRKTYLAVVYGNPPWPRGPGPGVPHSLERPMNDAGDHPDGHPDARADDHIIDLPLGLVADPDALISIRMEVRPDARPARTRVRVLEVHGDHALVCCMPITGRQHQIRAHLAAAGHPIVGDKLYAHGDEAFAHYCDHGLGDDTLALFKLPRQALHAAALTVPHPTKNKLIRIVTDLPDDLREFLDGPGSSV